MESVRNEDTTSNDRRLVRDKDDGSQRTTTARNERRSVRNEYDSERNDDNRPVTNDGGS